MRVTSAEIIPWEFPDLWGVSYQTDTGDVFNEMVGSKAAAQAALPPLGHRVSNDVLAHAEEPA